MKETKRKLMTFTFYDRSGIERDLEEQAAQGWMLEKTSAAGWIYRRIEPAKIHFSVVYFPAASAFDPHPSEEQERFFEFCEYTGWELVASNAQLQIFCNRNEDPVPIETDPVIELENIHASVKKTVLPMYLVNLVLAFMQIGLAMQRFSMDPIGELANLSAILSLAFWVMVIFFDAAQLFFYYRWLHKAKAAAEDGHFLETKSTDRFQLTVVILSSLAVVFMLMSFGGGGMIMAGVLMTVGIIGSAFLLTKLTNHLKKKNYSAKKNMFITYAAAIPIGMVICGVVLYLMVSIHLKDRDRGNAAGSYEFRGWTYYVYNDPIPLKVEDLIETDYDGYSYEIFTNESSPLLSRFEARQKTRHDALAEPEMQYRIIEVKVSFLYDWVEKLMLDEFDHNYAYPEDDPAWEEHVIVGHEPWEAERVYQLYLGGEEHYRYLLCYEKHIIEIDLDWEPDNSQMVFIGKTLQNI